MIDSYLLLLILKMSINVAAVLLFNFNFFNFFIAPIHKPKVQGQIQNELVIKKMGVH
jgi:hypothetical protein